MDDNIGDVLDEYIEIIEQSPHCRNIKSPERIILQERQHAKLQKRIDYKKLSLASVPSPHDFISFLERNLDITLNDFKRIIKFEIHLHKFALKNVSLMNQTIIIKKYLYKRIRSICGIFKDLIPSNLITTWIYWNQCKVIANSLESILLMVFDSFVLIYDVLTRRRYIYRTTVNSGAVPILLVGSKLKPVFAYAESGIYFPKIFVVACTNLQTITKLCDGVKGRYVGLAFSQRNVLVALKIVYENNALRFIIWNWVRGETLVVSEDEPTLDLHSESVLFKWNETLGAGLYLKRSTTLDEHSQIVNVIYITVFRQKLYEKLSVFFKLPDKFYRNFIPGDICITPVDSMYILDTTGDLYLLDGHVSLSLILKKKWMKTQQLKRMYTQVRLLYYRKGFLVSGPDGVLKRYCINKKQEWHCIWWMDLFNAHIKEFLIFGKTDNLYVLCPFQGVLRMENKRFETVYKFEKCLIKDVILIQPKCEYILAISDRRNILVLKVSNGEEVARIAFPEKFDKFPYLSNPAYPYIIFISDRVGLFYIYDINDFNAPFVATKIMLSPHRIMNATFTNEGLFLNIWIANISTKFVYWAVRKNNTYENFKIILQFHSSDNSEVVCPYVSSCGHIYILVMEKKQTNLKGNQLYIYQYPQKDFIDVCTLDHDYKMLYFTLQTMNYLYGSLKSNPNKFVKFSLNFKTSGVGKSIVEQSKCNTEFLLPHEGEFDFFSGVECMYSYGFDDGLLVVLDLKYIQVKRKFSAYFHRGAVMCYDSNKYGGGGIKKCFGSRMGEFIITLSQHGIITVHKFRNYSVDDYKKFHLLHRLYHKTMIKEIELQRKDSCVSISFATAKKPVKPDYLDNIQKLQNIICIRHIEQDIEPGSKWAHCYITQFSLNLVPKVFTSSSDDSLTLVNEGKIPESTSTEFSDHTIRIRRKIVRKAFQIIYSTLLRFIKEYTSNGRFMLPINLYIINRNELKDFLRRINDSEQHTEENIRKRMLRLMHKIRCWVKTFREPFNNAQVIRGILNPEIKAWTVGKKLSTKENWRKDCEKQWYERSVLHCGYSSQNLFPVHPRMQRKILVLKDNFPDVSYLNMPEVIYVEKPERKTFHMVDAINIQQIIRNAKNDKELRASLEFYVPQVNKDWPDKYCKNLIDYETIWKKLCTKKTYGSIKTLDNNINEAINENRKQQFLQSTTGDHFIELENKIICRKCKQLPIYAQCKHQPKCYPCFHDVKCTLSRYVFPEITTILRTSNVAPDAFCYPMRYINYYQVVLHPHVECCSLDVDKTIEVPSYIKPPLVKLKIPKPNIPKHIKSEKSSAPNKDNPNTKKKEPVWDDSLEKLIKICIRSNSSEELLRKLFFKCSKRIFCDDHRKRTLLKSLKNMMKYSSFFPLHTFMALPWLRELLKEVKGFKRNQMTDYKKMMIDYPEVITFKRVEYYDPFKIPGWIGKFMMKIADARRSLNHKLAQIYIMYSYKSLFVNQENEERSSDDSFDSDIAKSEADLICGYKKVPCYQVVDAGFEKEIFRPTSDKVRKRHPVKERIVIKNFDDNLKEWSARPLKQQLLLNSSNAEQYYGKLPYIISVSRDSNSKYLADLISGNDAMKICTPLFIQPQLPYITTFGVPLDCFTERKLNFRNTDLRPDYVLLGNTISGPNALYKVQDNSLKTTRIMTRNADNFKIMAVKNANDPFVPIQPHHPNTKKWRPFTLKLLLNAKKPLSNRLIPNINRLLTYDDPLEIHNWLKGFLEQLVDIQNIIVARLLSENFKQINRRQQYDYEKKKKLYYPIRAEETARWIALIIHELTTVSHDIIDNSEKILSYYCNEDIYKINPLHVSKERTDIVGKPYDPRAALLTGQSKKKSSKEQGLLNELKVTDYLKFDIKMYQPQQELDHFSSGPVHNQDYLYNLIINRALLEMCTDSSKIRKAPKDWFSWTSMQKGTPNWVLIVTVTLALRMFSCTINNITRRLYKILNEAKKYIRPEEPLIPKKRVKLEDTIEIHYDRLDKPLDSVKKLEDLTWKQFRFGSTGLELEGENQFSAYGLWGKRRFEILRDIEKKYLTKGKIKRQKIRMESKVEAMLRTDEQGLEMYLEQKRCWLKRFRNDPSSCGFPPILDWKNRTILDLGENIHRFFPTKFRKSIGNIPANSLLYMSVNPTPNRQMKAIKQVSQEKIDTKETKQPSKKPISDKPLMKMLILDGPTARYTIANNYYCNRFEYFTPINTRQTLNCIMFTIAELSNVRERLISSLRTMKHNVINFMLLIHIKKEQLKKKLAFFCTCCDYQTVFYKRHLKLVPDEKLNYLFEVDDEDNKYSRHGKLKKRPLDSENEDEGRDDVLEEIDHRTNALSMLSGGMLKTGYLTALLAYFAKSGPRGKLTLEGLNREQLKKLGRSLKKKLKQEKEKDDVIMEYKREIGWFTIHKQWFKWSYDFMLSYYGVFQLSGIENSIKTEARKANSVQKMKWEVRKIITSLNAIRRCYLVITMEYLYVRSAILSDIEYFRRIHKKMISLYKEIEELNQKKLDLKERILRDNPYLKQSTLDNLLNPTISIEMLKDVTFQELKNGYKFYYLRKKPVCYFYELNPQIGKYYQQVRSLNDIRLYPLMCYELRRELIEIRIAKQILHYKILTAHKRIEEFHTRQSRAYKLIAVTLNNLKVLHTTCYRKIRLLKAVTEQSTTTVSVYRKQLDQPLWQFIKPLIEGKEVRFVALRSNKQHPELAKIKSLHRLKEILITDRIQELLVIRKTLLKELKLKNLQLSLMKMPTKRFLDGASEDVIEHYKNYVHLNLNRAIPTEIKGYDKVFPKIHLNDLVSNYLKYISHKKCLECKGSSLTDEKLRPTSKECSRDGIWFRNVSKKLTKRFCHHFGIMAWYLKSLWEISDFKIIPKTLYVSTDTKKTRGKSIQCTPAEHHNKVEDFIRSIMIPLVPPPSPASSDDLPADVKMLLLAQNQADELTYNQDEIIFNYLRDQVIKLMSYLKEKNKTLRDISETERGAIFAKWITKLFENWHFRTPKNLPSKGNQDPCCLLAGALQNKETENILEFLMDCFKKHAAHLQSRNIERVGNKVAYTEHEDMLTKCINHISSLSPPPDNREITDTDSGTERECPLSVFAKFEDNVEYTLKDQQYVLILKLVTEQLKKYNRDFFSRENDCEHLYSNMDELFKDWIAFAFEKIFLHPVQYVFIRLGDRLVKMYDAVENMIESRLDDTRKLKAREAIISFFNDYRDLDADISELKLARKKSEETRLYVRDPLVKQWTVLKKKLDKLRAQNKHLEQVVHTEMEKTYPIINKRVITVNQKLAELLD